MTVRPLAAKRKTVRAAPGGRDFLRHFAPSARYRKPKSSGKLSGKVANELES